MSNNKIRVAILKAESDDFEIKDDFDHSLENMQKVVGGNIEAMTIMEKDNRRLTIWLNEEGKLDGLQPNFAVIDEETNKLLDYIVGDVLITSCDDEGETVGLNDEELEYVQNVFDFSKGTITPLFVSRTLFI